MRKNKTTKKHFEYFKKEVYRWQKFFGLFDWHIDCVHERKNLRAEVQYQVTSRMATIILSTDWNLDDPTRTAISKAAFHEICHLLLAPMALMLMGSFSKYEIDDKEHAVIMTLENTVWKYR